ncbi:response regulator [Flavobacterium pedocola]
MNTTIKIVLADDEELFRKGIAFILQREKNMEIVYEAGNGQELVSFLKESTLHPDIIIMDLKMPQLNGVEATKMIQNLFPHIKIIALSSYETSSFIANMINVGASSYLVKNSTPEEMIFTINEVFDKGFYYNEQVMKIINEIDLTTSQKSRALFDTDCLTGREKEVLQLICRQLNTKEIGERLFISARTVDGHRNNLLLKTESKNVAGLVVYAIQNKIVTQEDLML